MEPEGSLALNVFMAACQWSLSWDRWMKFGSQYHILFLWDSFLILASNLRLKQQDGLVHRVFPAKMLRISQFFHVCCVLYPSNLWFDHLAAICEANRLRSFLLCSFPRICIASVWDLNISLSILLSNPSVPLFLAHNERLSFTSIQNGYNIHCVWDFRGT